VLEKVPNVRHRTMKLRVARKRGSIICAFHQFAARCKNSVASNEVELALSGLDIAVHEGSDGEFYLRAKPVSKPCPANR